MPRLLIVHHTPSPAMQEILEAVVKGATDPEIEGVEVLKCAALAPSVPDVLEADGYLLGTPANIGYMSGALKHFFDTIYYPCLDATKGRIYGAYVHGNLGTEGAVKAIRTITTGLGWNLAAEPLELTGQPDKAALEQAWELGATIAAQLTEPTSS
ncbi:flavodoxin [Lentzea sp. NBRC 105346]|uniref:flavodoxin family protein n=1 Tax=Lentzea sp. NBRC 105346 TaxID=3032205 RepID=UPI0025565F16|nr:flavodoxin family protein [Lentzea sp. NBRC 105346]GLZ30284.1 flavodoxin [Lentzea sp. NBRC 105346]